MTQTDAAEARGDAASALELMGRRPLGPDGKPFWRPWRIRHLAQLVAMEELLPRWVTSRWILAQAMQTLQESSRKRALRSLEIAIEVRGGEQTLRGVDSVDARAKVVDRDWVYRQVYLYELGGLNDFLRSVASPDLVAGADRIQDWARAAMGGYRLLGHRPDAVTWGCLATGVRLVAPNIGSAVLVVPGECVIGRLVPVDRGSMFETAPLLVPEHVAEQVAHEPTTWLGVVTAAQQDGAEIATSGTHFGLLNDVPPVIWLHALLENHRGAKPPAVAELAVAALDTARRELAGTAPVRGASDVDVWPCLSAALLEPGVTEALVGVLTPDREEMLLRLSDLLAEPAASLCRTLAKNFGEAA